jgi:phage terminase large subunit-like protein
MIEADEEGYLQKRFAAKDHLKTIVDLTNGSTLKIKTFDMKVMTGAKPKGVLVDELHVMSSLSYASKVMGQIRGGLAVRDGQLADHHHDPVGRAALGLLQGRPDAGARDPRRARHG